MSKQPPVTAAVIRFTTLALALPIDLGVSPWVLLAVYVWWLLPAWVKQWLDVRDQWQGPPQ